MLASIGRTVIRRPILTALTVTSIAFIAPRPQLLTSLITSNTGNLGSAFSTSSANMTDSTPRLISKTEDEWKAELSPEEYNVIRKKGTERPYTGEYDNHKPKKGVYVCRACKTPLYTAEDKFSSGCGWPAFDNNFKGAVERHTDRSLGMERTEIVCKACGGHLGHVFKGERFTSTNERHCVNSVSIRFDPDGTMEGEKEKQV